MFSFDFGITKTMVVHVFYIFLKHKSKEIDTEENDMHNHYTSYKQLLSLCL